MLTKKAAEDDLAPITIGRNAGEGRDRKVENDFNLSEAEQTMIQNVAEASTPPVKRSCGAECRRRDRNRQLAR